jgi:hypothetical protein
MELDTNGNIWSLNAYCRDDRWSIHSLSLILPVSVLFPKESLSPALYLTGTWWGFLLCAKELYLANGLTLSCHYVGP